MRTLTEFFKAKILYFKFLFEKPFTIRKLLCRRKGHPCGVVWYNPGGLEPDMHCRNCGDNLG